MDSPLRLTSYVWEPQHGQLSLTVSCELTVELAHGSEGTFVPSAPSFDRDEATIAEANLRAPFKPRCDLVMVGNAYSPSSEPEVTSLVVRLRIGDFTKAVRVVGDRLWTRENGRLMPGQPRPFRQMRLAHERAPRSADNPIGIDQGAIPVEYRAALPNLESLTGTEIPLLGPIPASAPRRASLLTPSTASWVRGLLNGSPQAAPGGPIAYEYFNIAPTDQQLEYIPVGATLVLENAHPEHSLYTSRLPAARPRAFVFDPRSGSHQEIELRCDTLWLDVDREIATLVYRGVTHAPHRESARDVSARIEEIARESQSEDMARTRMGAFSLDRPMPFFETTPSLPDSPGQAGSVAPSPIADDPSTPPVPAKPAAQIADMSGANKMFITQEIDISSTTASLPFETQSMLTREMNVVSDVRAPTFGPPPVPGPVAHIPFAAPPVPRHDEETTNSMVDDATHAFKGRDPLHTTVDHEAPTPAPFEFQQERAQTNPAPAKPHKRLVPPEIPPTRQPPFPPRRARSRTEAGLSAISPIAIGAVEEPSPVSVLGSLKLGTTKLVSPDDDEQPTRMRQSAPPPPLSQPGKASAGSSSENGMGRGETASLEESTESTETRKGIEARTLEDAEAEADRDAFEFPLPPSDGFEVDGVTLEHCAAVRAAIAMPGNDKATLLAKNDLDDPSWMRIEKAHMARIDKETSNGVMDLLSRYDAAYVAAQDKLRQPIGVKEYARIVVAREVGTLTETMADIGIPRTELMRLDRVWKRRREMSPEVDRAISQAIDLLRPRK